jgi:nitrile hydratase subunit beta
VNGGQDLGGMMGFGPVDAEPDEPTFHADWERRVFGLTLAMGAAGRWNIDKSRHARERLDPAEYLASTYYEIWAKGLERLLLEAGLVSADELEEKTALAPPASVAGVLEAENVPAAMARGGSTQRPAVGPAHFAVGDRVGTRTMHPAGHTRLPRYARGKSGVVERVNGAHVLPDSNAHDGGENPEWLYTVRFTGTELWGPDADPTLTVSIDAWESYLEPA